VNEVPLRDGLIWFLSRKSGSGAAQNKVGLDFDRSHR